MKKLTRDELEAIIRRDMPGHRLADQVRRAAEDAARTAVEAATPELDAVQRKYARKGAPVAARKTPEKQEGSDVEMVLVQPEAVGSHPSDPASAPKAVVVSKSQRKIIGHQG